MAIVPNAPQQQVMPAFEAEKVTGEFYRTVIHIEKIEKRVGKDGEIIRYERRLVPYKEKYTEAYDVYFPQKHSVRIAADNAEELGRLGIIDSPPLVDMSTGDIVDGNNYTTSPKALVEQSLVRSRGRKIGGLATLDGDVE